MNKKYWIFKNQNWLTMVSLAFLTTCFSLMPLAYAQEESSVSTDPQPATETKEAEKVAPSPTNIVQQEEVKKDISELSLEELMNMEVSTATKSKQKISKTPAVVTVINSEEIKNIGAQYVSQVLNLVPGFEVNRGISVGTHDAVGVRGRMTDAGEDVLVLLDGQRLNEAYTGGGFAYLKYMPTFNVKRVEVVRGPGSTLYGSNAFVGIINIITETKNDMVKNGQISVQGGNLGDMGTTVKAGIGNENRNLMLSAKWLKDSGDDYHFNSGYNRADGAQPVVKDAIDKSIDLGLRGQFDDFTVQTDFFIRQREGFMPWGFLDNAWDSTILDHNQDETYMLRAQASYDFSITDDLAITPTFRFMKNRARQNYFLVAPAMTVAIEPTGTTSLATNGWIGGNNHDTENYEFELQASYVMGDHTIVGGSIFQIEKMKDIFNTYNVYPFPTSLTQTDFGQELHRFYGEESYLDPRDRKIFGLYLEDTWKINEQLGLTAGVRFDRYSDFGNAINPRGVFVYSPMDQLHIKALYGRSYRAPTFMEMHVRNNPVLVSNKDLGPQKIQTAELNTTYMFNPNLMGVVSVYHNWYSDLITLSADTGTPLPQFVNGSGTEKDLGAEAEIRYNYEANKYVSFNYGYIHPTDANDDVRPYIAQHKIGFVANYDIWKDRVIFNLNGFLRASRENPVPGDQDLASDTALVLNTNLRFKDVFKEVTDFNGLFGPVEASVACYNLLNDQWKGPGFSPLNAPENIPNRGFEIVAKLTADF